MIKLGDVSGQASIFSDLKLWPLAVCSSLSHKDALSHLKALEYHTRAIIDRSWIISAPVSIQGQAKGMDGNFRALCLHRWPAGCLLYAALVLVVSRQLATRLLSKQ